MYIGLYDQNLSSSKERAFPNLEIMLLSSYYKKRGVVELIPDLEDSLKYDLVYVNQEKKAVESVSERLFIQENINWFGRGVTGNFIPLPKDFYLEIPDKNIYLKYFNFYFEKYSTRKKTIINKMLSPDFTLLKLTESEESLVPLEKIKYQNQKIILFDNDFFKNQSSFNYLEKLKSNKCYFLNRQRTSNLNSFIFCLENDFHPIDRNRTGVSYHGDLTNKDFLKIYPNLSIAFPLGVCNYDETSKNISPQSFYKRELIKKGNYFFYCRAHGKNVPIIDSSENNYSCPEKTILNRFCSYTQQIGLTSQINFLTYSKKFSKIFKETQQKMMKEDDRFFTLFSTVPQKIYKRGVWKL